MTTFTPGKYRMANGEMAIVKCDVGENPIGKQDLHPIKGFTKDGGRSWTRGGKLHGNDTPSGYDLLEPWTDPPTLLKAAEEAAKLLELRILYSNAECLAICERLKAAIAAEKARTA